jgi:hypothetical protein
LAASERFRTGLPLTVAPLAGQIAVPRWRIVAFAAIDVSSSKRNGTERVRP